MENDVGLKKILQYILLYYMDDSDKQTISDQLSKEISIVGKEIVTEFLDWHRLLPLLPRNSEIDNTEIRSNIEEKNRRLLDLSKEIIIRFENEKIDFCFLKGISLLVSVYDDLSLRSFNDIDLFVAKKNLDKAESIISSMGFRHGYTSGNSFVPATKAQIKYQRLYTHELFKFIKFHNGMFYPIDINHLFSWIGLDRDKQICLENVDDNLTLCEHNGLAFPILNDTYQFVHLCVHFYNEAMYFALDMSHHNKVPHEIRLFRLLDICFLIAKKRLNVYDIAKISFELHSFYKMNYVLSLVHYLFGDLIDLTEFNYYYNIEDSELENKYYLPDGSSCDWPISFSKRIFDIKKRNELVFRV